jgi:hypothetical protein
MFVITTIGANMNTRIVKPIIKAIVLEALTKAKTLYIFDFDHTIAKTYEENIRLPNGRIDLRAFSNLSDETKPNGEIFDLFANNVASNPESTYILTARPNAVKNPMIEWLESQGIDIDPANIVCLGDGAASKKRDWIKDKVLETKAKRVLFWDDRERNTKAVDSLNDKEKYPEMKGVKIQTTTVMKT